MNFILLTSFVLVTNLVLVNCKGCGCGHQHCGVHPENGCSCSDKDCVIRRGRCGTLTYNKDRFTCCNGFLLPSKGGKTWCCGNINFNPRDRINCCTGLGLTKAPFCNCMGRFYRANEGMCCKGRFYPILPGSTLIECCGDIPFDPYRFVCRREKLIPRNEL